MSGRLDPRPSGDADDAADADADERTTVVDRSAPAEPADDHEHTVVVDRPAPAGEADGETVVVQRAAPVAPADNETIVVDREPSPAAKSGPSAASARRGRRRITLPPVEAGFGAEPVEAVGPGAISSYTAREIRPAPAVAPEVPLGPDATRAPAPSMPSVGRRSQVFGIAGVAGFALATTVSIVGLVAIIVSLVG